MKKNAKKNERWKGLDTCRMIAVKEQNSLKNVTL